MSVIAARIPKEVGRAMAAAAKADGMRVPRWSSTVIEFAAWRRAPDAKLLLTVLIEAQTVVEPRTPIPRTDHWTGQSFAVPPHIKRLVGICAAAEGLSVGDWVVLELDAAARAGGEAA